ncbi:hypothetical protein ACWDZ4_00535 [Streptomyces sp. NPDC003016]
MDTLEAYWQHAVAPSWPRMRAVLEAGILHRAQRLAEGGAAALFTGLHPNVHWEPGPGGRGPGPGCCGCARWVRTTGWRRRGTV